MIQRSTTKDDSNLSLKQTNMKCRQSVFVRYWQEIVVSLDSMTNRNFLYSFNIWYFFRQKCLIFDSFFQEYCVFEFNRTLRLYLFSVSRIIFCFAIFNTDKFILNFVAIFSTPCAIKFFVRRSMMQDAWLVRWLFCCSLFFPIHIENSSCVSKSTRELSLI